MPSTVSEQRQRLKAAKTVCSWEGATLTNTSPSARCVYDLSAGLANLVRALSVGGASCGFSHTVYVQWLDVLRQVVA